MACLESPTIFSSRYVFFADHHFPLLEGVRQGFDLTGTLTGCGGGSVGMAEF